MRLRYRCDFQRYDYARRPIDVYLAAVENPAFATARELSIDDLGRSGAVRIFRPDMTTYVYTGVLGFPTFRFPSFPSGDVRGSFTVNTVASGIYRGRYAFAAVFVRRDTGAFVRNDGYPAAGSGAFTPFEHRVKVLTRTIHVGDAYDPYMATWEVPRPMALRVDARFEMEHVPLGRAVLRGGFWGTYYSNPVYLNGAKLGIIPTLMNANVWAWAVAGIHSSRFRAGTNVMTFGCDRNQASGHWDNYMAKEWEIYYN